VTSTTTSSQRYAPTITWPHITGSNFINWKTYKSNGANLGGWLEKEKTHDPICKSCLRLTVISWLRASLTFE